MIYSLNSLFKQVGLSRQGFHQMLHRQRRVGEQNAYLSVLIARIRDEHPTLSSRAMYYKIRPEKMGRDAFEGLCASLGYQVERKLNQRRTTDSTGVVRFDNLAKDVVPNGINQLWSSDITYFEVSDRFYYLTFIIDNYSRRILGHHVSERLFTEQTTLPALQMALRMRKLGPGSNLIFHSDGGGQYYDKAFLSLTRKYGIRNSMCDTAWENGMAERLNGVIKNNYLQFRSITTLEELKKEVDRSVLLYNKERPHKSLNYVTPIEYEKQVLPSHLKTTKREKNMKAVQAQKSSARALSGASPGKGPELPTHLPAYVSSNT
jgi:transposase InsO family protein